MRFAILTAALLLAACSTPAQKLANDMCHGHWTVITSQVGGKTVYSAACASAAKGAP
jgi:starvation-inducible outer membrane lipoprotein